MAWKDRSGKWSDAIFADVTLGDAESDAFLSWMKSVKVDMPLQMQEMLQEGWKISLKADFENSCYICSLTMQEEDHINRDMVVTSRSDDHEEAFWLNVYKIMVMYPGQRLPTRDDRKKKNWG